jgi:adenosylmethionine---8-amino-7-oxononanoate aminotransferase
MSLLARDAACLWHPYTQHGLEREPLPVVAARGSWLELEDGRRVLDAISSWWCCLHGHGRPELVAALATQAARLDHVLFAGVTHEPAVALAERLLTVAPPGLARVFYSDNGSTAVEVALKLAYQACARRGEPARRLFVCFEGAYHGDTFGAMAVGDPDPFFAPFAPLLFEVRRLPLALDALAALLEREGEQVAAVILEPLVQGAGGMLFHAPEVVAGVAELARRHGAYFVADEVMTGFGRTGTLFACEQAGVTPDLLCLAKGLTGGLLPLAATLATAPIFDAFVSEERSRAFFHGHTFTANPMACAVGLASLELALAEQVPARLEQLGRTMHERLSGALGGCPHVSGLRQRGGIVAFDLASPAAPTGYLSTLALELRRRAIERGVLLRPLGSVLYAMPPASTSLGEAVRIAEVLAELAAGS